MRVDEHTIELASVPMHYRSAAVSGDLTPVYLHGLPTSSRDWTEVLERTGGVAPDLMGFGRSGKGGHLEYSLSALAGYVSALIDHLELDRVALVGHQWGALVALELAGGGGTERLALVSPLPLTAGHEWGRGARALRTPALGELIMGATTRRLLARRLRQGGPWTGADLAAIWDDFDQGTQRAILRLYRATAPDHFAGRRAPDTDTLVILGEHDPWTRPELIHQLLPEATIRQIPEAGHWPWRERPEAIEALSDFLRS